MALTTARMALRGAVRARTALSECKEAATCSSCAFTILSRNYTSSALLPSQENELSRNFTTETRQYEPVDSVSSELFNQYRPNHFNDLVHELRDILGPRFGIDSDDCDTAALMDVMRKYESRQSEWQKYALVDRSIPYTRNLVDNGNGRSNLLVLVWNPGQGSAIHDHSDSHCIMKMLSGHLKEELYENPGNSEQTRPLRLWRETMLAENQVAYMSDKLGIHRIMNPDPHRVAVSLHLYTPPKTQLFGCNVYDLTGKRRTIPPCGFYSKGGVKEGVKL